MGLVRLPAAMPHLLSGVKLAIAYAYDNFDNRRMYGLIIFVIGFMVAVNTIVLL